MTTPHDDEEMTAVPVLIVDDQVPFRRDGTAIGELGPGAVLGERAVLEGGRRTSTLTAATKCRVAAVPADRIDRDALEVLRTGHRREGL